MARSSTFDALPDAELWRLVCGGNESAFESCVRRHQSVVSAVAYNACGDLAWSEDVAQETFWAAWRDRLKLEEPGRLKAWLCGIARNLAHHVRQRGARKADSAGSLESAGELSLNAPGPAEAAVSREEEQLVWQTLEQIPEEYREPLILFYREQQSTAEVAQALGLSEDAARQRLSRGRTMLRDQVAEVVASALHRSRPTARFTLAVVAGVGAASTGAKAALAGTGVAAAGKTATGAALKAAAAGASAGMWGGVLGSLGGFAGGWLGTWLPAQLAPTRGERLLLQRSGNRILFVSVLFSLALLIVMLAWARDFSALEHLIVMGTWFVAFGAYITIDTVGTVRAVNHLRKTTSPESDPNETRLRSAVVATARRYRGRVFRSQTTLLGWSVLDINVRDPRPPGGSRSGEDPENRPRVARGWIAIGDDARGILLAIGGKARGIVAIGGRAVGLVSFGGIAVGGIAVGGVSLGILSCGGVGIGGLTLGGLAVGWQAAGGAAFAWDTAAGGFALAHHAAIGGAAFAHDHAVGGAAWAAHANDEAAKAVLSRHPLADSAVRWMAWSNTHTGWVITAIVAISILPTFVFMPLMYRRETNCGERSN